MKKVFITLYFLSLIGLVNYTYGEIVNKVFNSNQFELLKDTYGCDILALDNNFMYPESDSVPNIPYCYVSVLLPPNTDINNYDFQYTDSIVSTNIYLYPSCLPIKVSQIQNTIPSKKVISYTNTIYPKTIVELTSVRDIDGYRCANFRIYPFSYNAKSRTLAFIKDVTISYTLKSAHINTPLAISRKPIIEKIVVNPQVTGKYFVANNATTQTQIEYLIITSNSLKSAYEPLRRWKTMKGVKTKIISVEDIYNDYSSNSQTLKIKQCIYDYYTNYKIRYVLLGGDVNIVPTAKCYEAVQTTDDNGNTYIEKDEGIPCDLYYACFNGQFDWNADGDNLIGEVNDGVDLSPQVHISRLPVKNQTDVTNYVKKTRWRN